MFLQQGRVEWISRLYEMKKGNYTHTRRQKRENVGLVRLCGGNFRQAKPFNVDV